MSTLPYPKSFPTASEEAFLALLLCPDAQLPERWRTWQAQHAFDALPEAQVRLVPLLYLRLKRAQVNDQLTERIRGIYKLAWVKNHRLLAAASGALALLEHEAIYPVVLKGIPLLLSVYQDIGARMLSDADLLIAPQDARRAVRLMREHGWTRHTGPFPNLEQFTDESLPRVVKEITFTNHEHIELDLHWRTFDTLHAPGHPEAFPYTDLYARSQTVSHQGTTYRTPSAEDLLLHLIVHGAEGSPVKALRWVVDAAVLLQTSAIAWDALVARAVEYDVVLELTLALNYLHERTYAAIPEAVRDTLHAQPIAPGRRAAYYARGNKTYTRFGGLPRLWCTYWHYEAPPGRIRGLMGFVPYLTAAWGFNHVYELVPFVVHKYALRFAYHLRHLKSA